MKKGSKSKNNAVSIGVAFRPVTRCKLDLIAKGLDRPLGWVIRDAVASYFENVDMEDYRARFPRLAVALDQAIVAAGGDADEIFGLEQPASSIEDLSPAIQRVSPSSQPVSSAIAGMAPAILHLEGSAELGS